MDFDSEKLNYIVLNATQPVLFKNILNCEILKWDLNDWKRILRNENLEFRYGANKFTKNPQWERTTKLKTGKFEDFLKHSSSENQNEWLYFDYKYLKDWFSDIEEINNMDLGLSKFGFPNLTIQDCTIWIGSKGAHTPCHSDTYGCNLIFQVYGKKQWLVFPPNEDLKATRVPYEESSIYSKLNFFSPTVEDFEGVFNCKKIILNPGDILLLPHKWWHYVENLETAISINIWLPLSEDDKERLDESLVQLLVKQLTNNLPKENLDIILNPNEEKDLATSSFAAAVEMVETCKNIYTKRILDLKEQKNDKIPFSLRELVEKHEFIETLPTLSPEAFKDLMNQQKNRFKENCEKNDENNDKITDIIQLLNALTDPEVISLIRQKLLR